MKTELKSNNHNSHPGSDHFDPGRSYDTAIRSFQSMIENRSMSLPDEVQKAVLKVARQLELSAQDQATVAGLSTNPDFSFYFSKSEFSHPQLSPEDAFQMLLDTNILLIMDIVNQYQTFKVPEGDLIVSGQEGLWEGLKRFSFKRGSKLSTYVTYWIKSEIGRTVRKEDRTIRVPENSFSSIGLFKQLISKGYTFEDVLHDLNLARKLGLLTELELATLLGESEEPNLEDDFEGEFEEITVGEESEEPNFEDESLAEDEETTMGEDAEKMSKKIIKLAKGRWRRLASIRDDAVSLDQPLGPTDSRTIRSKILVDLDTNCLQSLITSQLREEIEEIFFSCLPPRQAWLMVLFLFYDLDYTEAAKRLGYKEKSGSSQASQIISKLRENSFLQEWFKKNFPERIGAETKTDDVSYL